MSGYDLFVSYSRADDTSGWVSGLVDVLREDHRRYATTDLRVYRDTDSNHLGDDWRLKIRRALRDSRVMLVCVSPNYFASPTCRFEWEEFAAYHGQRAGSAESVTSIYFVEVSDPATADVESWRESVSRVHHLDVQPWFPQGRDALADAEVRRRIEELSEQIWLRGKRAELDRIGNLRRHNPTFVGRVGELRALRDQVLGGRDGTVTVVNGLGGQGKTELITTYASVNRTSYGAGTWIAPAAGADTMSEVLCTLTRPLGLAIDDAEARDEVADRVLTSLDARIGAVEDPDASSALLILDNVDAPGVLARASTTRLDIPGLHVVATTRLSEAELAINRLSLAFFAVDGLGTDDVHRLLCEHQPGGAFPTQRREAARRLAELLSGFTLAAEQAAVHLGAHPYLDPDELHATIAARDHPELDDARLGTLHEGTLGAVLSETLEQLPLRARRALAVAAWLPPDAVSWSWLEQLSTTGDNGERWPSVRRILEGRRLITPSDRPGAGRVHRLVHAELRTERSSRADAARAAVAEQVTALLDDERSREVTALDAEVLTHTGLRLLREEPELAPVEDLVAAHRFLDDFHWSHELDELAEALVERCRTDLASAPSDDARRHLSRALGNLARIHATDDPATARAVAEEALTLRSHQAESTPHDLHARLELAFAHAALSDTLRSHHPEAARHSANRALDACRAIAHDHPYDADIRSTLADCLNHVGSLYAQVDPERSRRLVLEAVDLLRTCLGEDPDDPYLQSSLAAALSNVGALQVEVDPGVALAAHLEAIDLHRALLARRPAHAATMRQLAQVLSNAGAHLRLRDPERALALRDEALATRRDVAAMTGETRDQLDLAGALVSVGQLTESTAPEQAIALFRESLTIRRGYVRRHPKNLDECRNLVVTLSFLADVEGRANRREGRLLWEECLAIATELADRLPDDIQAQRNLSTTLSHVATFVAPDDPALARTHRAAALDSSRRLNARYPSNRRLQRELSIVLHNEALIGDEPDKVLPLLDEARMLRTSLVAALPADNVALRDLAGTLHAIATRLPSVTDPAAAQTWSALKVTLDDLARLSVLSGREQRWREQARRYG